MSVPPAPVQQNLPLGIALRLCAMASLSMMVAIIKIGHEAGIALVELVFYRFAFGLPPLLAWMAWTRDIGAWRTKRPLAHAVRAAIGLTTMILGFSTLAYLPLAEATTIGFAAPLFSVVLSALLLNERVGRHRWSAVALGFVGVLVVVRPGGSDLPLAGVLLGLGGAAGVAAVTITVRQIGRTEPATTTVLWFTFLSMGATALLLPFHAQAHGAAEWLILIGLGLAGGAGQLFMTASLRQAPVSVVVPLDYTQLLWAVLFGWLIWDTRPPVATWAGAALIVATGLYTFYRERRLTRPLPESSPPAGG